MPLLREVTQSIADGKFFLSFCQNILALRGMVDIRIIGFHLGQFIGDAGEDLFLKIVVFYHDLINKLNLQFERANLRFLFIGLTKKFYLCTPNFVPECL